MKKLAIASASMALAAMPMVGVFAVDGPVSVTDNVTVVIGESCTFQATANGSTVNPSSGANPTITRNFSKDATLGALVYLAGDPTGDTGSTDANPIVIQGVCNSGQSGGSGKSGSWTISALGANEAKMVKGGNASDTDNIPTNLNTSGTASGWSMMIESAGANTDFSTYHAVPSGTAAPVANGTANGTAFSFQPKYRVYVGTAQASGTYTGTVVYTIASTWN